MEFWVGLALGVVVGLILGVAAALLAMGEEDERGHR